VVWQQDVRCIVMLTAEKEGGQIKAHNYWEKGQYGYLRLEPLSEKRASLEPSRIHRYKERNSLGQRRSTVTSPSPSRQEQEQATQSPKGEQPYVIVRRFMLSNQQRPFEPVREITQLQYSHWPDFGAPAHPAHLLGLVEQCDAVVRSMSGASSAGPDPPNARPVLVHCSAGCGRTGTFCTVDSVIDMMRRQRQTQREKNDRGGRAGTPMDIDGETKSKEKSFFDSDNIPDHNYWQEREDIDLIEKTVEDFRLQRLSMVQSLRQFVLCYESVLEWLAEQKPRSA